MTDYEYFRARDQIVPDLRANPDPAVLVEKAAYGLNLSRGKAAEFVERVLTDLNRHVDRATKAAAQRPRG